MIEFREDVDASIVTLWFDGLQTHDHIVGVVTGLDGREELRGRFRLYCDWTHLRGWACDTRLLPVNDWAAIASRIDRAAIVHHHRWNRQAAWLAALLRRGKTEVRSWRPEEANHAAQWVREFEVSAAS